MGVGSTVGAGVSSGSAQLPITRLAAIIRINGIRKNFFISTSFMIYGNGKNIKGHHLITNYVIQVPVLHKYVHIEL